MAIRLIIQGLRRSGTTIFWQTFRQDKRLCCYDEPLSPQLHVLPNRGALKNPEEFIELLRRDVERFWERYTPVHFSDELRAGLSDRHAEWIRFVADSAECVAIDTTRCHFKLEALAELAPDAVLVHLWRPPASLASSHMLPSGAGRRGRLRQRMHRLGFWTRTTRYNGWNFESIIGDSTETLFAKRLEQAGVDPATIYGLPAVARLLAYWKVAFERVERDGPRCFGERFISQRFDDFCAEPRISVERIYARLGLKMPDMDFGRVHPPNGAHEPDHEEWRRYLRLLELPETP